LLKLFGDHDKTESYDGKNQLGQGSSTAVEEAVSRIREVEPNVDEEHLRNTLQQIREIESQIREKEKDIDISMSVEVEASSEQKLKKYRPFRF